MIGSRQTRFELFNSLKDSELSKEQKQVKSVEKEYLSKIDQDLEKELFCNYDFYGTTLYVQSAVFKPKNMMDVYYYTSDDENSGLNYRENINVDPSRFSFEIDTLRIPNVTNPEL